MTVDRTVPREFSVGSSTITLRPLSASDSESVMAFAARMPLHDLLFLQRDIRNPKVVSAWIEQVERGQIHSLLAIGAEGIEGCTALVIDDLSWSPHVAEIRILIGPDSRRTGLGRLLAEECIATARDLNVEKLFVRLTPDQDGALNLFEDMGFLPEALLREHVRDAAGVTHDIAIMSLNLARQQRQQQLYGVGEG